MKVMARTLVALMLFALESRADAQDAGFGNRFDKPTLAALTAIVDSARGANLPTAPLVDKALEGAAKRSDNPQIIAAVRQLFVQMGSARRVLGTAASPDEIKVAAATLGSGVSEHDLELLRAASGRRPVTMPLAVLTDLIGRNVPIATAAGLVIQLARSGVTDQDLTQFQRNVRADIERGADPSAAATTRARGLLLRPANPESKPPE